MNFRKKFLPIKIVHLHIRVRVFECTFGIHGYIINKYGGFVVNEMCGREKKMKRRATKQ